MKNRIYAFSGFMLVVAMLFAYWQTVFVIPQKIESGTKHLLRSVFDASRFDYTRKESGLTHQSYQGIKLDKDGFSRIEQIDIYYSPFSLFFTGTISNVDILVPEITISINERDIHTYVQYMLASPAPHWLYTIDTLGIEGGRINLLTQNMGALRIGFEGIMRTNGDEKSAQFQIKAAQKQLSGDLKLSGAFSANRNWHIDGTLEDGRLDHDLLQLSRVTGQMTLDSAGDDAYYAKSEMSIGGLRTLSGHAVGDIAASYELDRNGYNFVAGGKALGFDDIEIGVAYDSGKPDIITGTIFTPSLPELIRYYTADHDTLSDINHKRLLQNIFLTYEMPVDQLWSAEKHILLRFNRLDIADFSSVFKDGFYGRGLLRGAVKVKLQNNEIVVGGMAVSGQNGNFSIEKQLLKLLLKKIARDQDSEGFLKQAGDFHYEALDVSVTGADTQTGDRSVSIRLRSHQDNVEDTNYAFTYHDDFPWLWDALIGRSKD